MLYWANNGVPPTNGIFLKKQPGAIFPDKANNPLILRDDTFEKSFAGQKQTSIRLPFGPPNAYQRTIGDISMLSNPLYPIAYQKNIRNIQIGTPDWRVDPKFNSPFNNYASMHMPEADLESISKWGGVKDSE